MSLFVPKSDTDPMEVIRRAVTFARPQRTAPRWVAVKQALGYGSGISRALCRYFRLDPDEILKP
jgi:hypothetical protein